jgi:hypothetical protein
MKRTGPGQHRAPTIGRRCLETILAMVDTVGRERIDPTCECANAVVCPDCAHALRFCRFWHI